MISQPVPAVTSVAAINVALTMLRIQNFLNGPCRYHGRVRREAKNHHVVESSRKRDKDHIDGAKRISSR